MELTRFDILFFLLMAFSCSGLFFVWLSEKMVGQNKRYYERIHDFIGAEEARYMALVDELRNIKKELEKIKSKNDI